MAKIIMPFTVYGNGSLLQRLSKYMFEGNPTNVMIIW